MPTKKRTVNFYTLEKQDWETDELSHADCVQDVIGYIKGLARVERRYKLTKDKICFLDRVSDLNDNTHTIMFKSAKTDYRPKLLDRVTVEERENPKKRTEGDGEKTHIAIKYSGDEVFIVLEKNGRGITINSLVKYLKKYTKKYFDSKKKKMRFSYVAKSLAKENFLAEVKKLERVIIGEVFVDKKILGSEALNFSDRTQSVKHNIILRLNAEKKDTIFKAIEDMFHKSIGAKSVINKIRVMGKSRQTKHDVVLDTSFIQKVENINAEINDNTGEVNTTNILTQLKEIADKL